MNTNNTPFIHLINIHHGIWCVGLSNKGKKQNVRASLASQVTRVRVAEQNASNVDKAHFQQRLKKKKGREGENLRTTSPFIEILKNRLINLNIMS